MFEFTISIRSAGKQQVIATQKLTPDDFMELSRQLGAPVLKARKVGFVAALKTTREQTIETLWNGKESQITAQPGDWVITNLAPDKSVLLDGDSNINQYAIGKDKFPRLYERQGGENTYGEIYRAISQVEALYVPGGFEILAPWGETQRADQGYLLCNGNEIYGNHKDTFDLTYEIISRES